MSRPDIRVHRRSPCQHLTGLYLKGQQLVQTLVQTVVPPCPLPAVAPFGHRHQAAGRVARREHLPRPRASDRCRRSSSGQYRCASLPPEPSAERHRPCSDGCRTCVAGRERRGCVPANRASGCWRASSRGRGYAPVASARSILACLPATSSVSAHHAAVLPPGATEDCQRAIGEGHPLDRP